MTVADRQIKNINKNMEISILILDGAHNTPDGVFFRKVSRRGERVNDLDRRKVRQQEKLVSKMLFRLFKYFEQCFPGTSKLDTPP
ncbi:hypothetical protein STW0522RAO56_39830 [Raoultella planticola]|nr:hypothetical protein CWM52_05020 [Raoultella sp. T31]BBV77929.1 hypothetical protein STW0522RAO56_39830 [Raoultella planticola]